MHRISRDKAQVLIDTVESYRSWMLRCWAWFSGKEFGGATLAVLGPCCLFNRWLQNKSWSLFLLFTFFHESEKSSSDFFPLAETSSGSKFFTKAEWHKVNFQIAEDTCTLAFNSHACVMRHIMVILPAQTLLKVFLTCSMFPSKTSFTSRTLEFLNDYVKACVCVRSQKW